MIQIGKYNSLKVVKLDKVGAFLDAEEYGDTLLPKRNINGELSVGDVIDVFLYVDSKDRVAATTDKPMAKADGFGFLKVQNVNKIGAFLDWGLPKDLLVPYNQMHESLSPGQEVVVHVIYDPQSERLLGSTRIIDYLNQLPPTYKQHQQVEVLVFEKHELGYRAIVNEQHLGIIYDNELYKKIKIGQTLKAYVKKVREDGRIDLSLEGKSHERAKSLTDIILDKLDENDGVLAISDKSSPEAIKRIFNVSKKVYKGALGQLYKERKIEITPTCIKKV